MSESDVRVVCDVSDSIHVSKWDYRKHGLMGLSGNAGRSRHGVGSREDAAGARRVKQAALPGRNRPQAGVPAPPGKKKFEVSPNKYWTKAESRIVYANTVFCVLRLPSPSERRDLGDGQSVSR